MTKRKQHKHYSDEFKEEALRLSEKVGVAQASRELGVYSSQLYHWRSSAVKQASSSDRENTLAIEKARLKNKLATQAEELEIFKKTATYFAKNQK